MSSTFDAGTLNAAEKALRSSLAAEIARVRHGQDVTASDLADRLMPWVKSVVRGALEA